MCAKQELKQKLIQHLVDFEEAQAVILDDFFRSPHPNGR
ncbi:hypothetical protein N752_08005 [Desulforamulus aquiferis]|nr:hypothetical protein N752_08005 [Desulforamulus aquiferis]